MVFRDYLRVATRYWYIILAVTLVSLAVAYGLSAAATPFYRSTAAIYLSPVGSTPNELAQGSSFLEGNMESYAELVSTSAVLDPVIDELGLEGSARDLSGSVRASAASDSVILRVTATSASAEEAAKKANAAADSLSQRIAELAPNRPDGSPSVEAALVQEATVPSAPFAPNTQRNLAAGLVAGLVLGYLAALARTLLDPRPSRAAELHAIVGAPVLAEVPNPPKEAAANELRGAYGEAVQRLRANLENIDPVDGGAPQLVVTSPRPGEGKTAIALSLAQSSAHAGQRVLLIDADLRRPAVHKALGIEPSVGLSTVLMGNCDLADAVLTTGRGNLHVLPCGELPANPTELLSLAEMDTLLQQARRDFDLVVIDSPPVLPVVDALVLARKAGGSILVTKLGKARREELQDAVESFRTSRSPLLGVVITGAPTPEKSSYYSSANQLRTPPAASGTPTYPVRAR